MVHARVFPGPLTDIPPFLCALPPQAVDVIRWLSKEWVNVRCSPENKTTLLEKVKGVQNAMIQCYNNSAIALSKMSGCPSGHEAAFKSAQQASTHAANSPDFESPRPFPRR